MAQNISDALEAALLNHIFATPAYTPNTGLKVGLCSTADDTSYTEVTYTNYARAPITFGPAANRRVTQDADLEFPTCGATGASADFYAIFNDSGDYLAWGALSSQKVITTNNTPTLITGQVWIEFIPGAISDFLANTLLDLVFNGVAYGSPTTYVALSNADMADASVTPTPPNPPFGYANTLVPSWNITVGATNFARNATEIIFPAPSGPWTAILALAIVDAGNNILFYDNIPGGEGQEPDIGDSVRFIPESITVSFE